MSTASNIEWTDTTWNPVVGCTKVSEGCRNCYAMRTSARMAAIADTKAGTQDPENGYPLTERQHAYREVVKRRDDGIPLPQWNNEVRCIESALSEPLRWRTPRMIFVNSQSDLFHESVPFDFIDRVFAVMALCPQHIFQILTKRPERMAEYLENRSSDLWPVTRWADEFANAEVDFNWPLPNVWLGTSVENQDAADDRIPHLLRCPAAVRFLSCEPLLGAVDLLGIASPHGPNGAFVFDTSGQALGIGWIIVGGESGPGARPMHPAWARSIRDQCADAGVPFFFKQWGEWSLIYDRDRDDPHWNGVPEVRSSRERWVNHAGGHGFHGERVCMMRRVGKKAAGRLLDGVEHNGMPEAGR